jgi:hypothetical protein
MFKVIIMFKVITLCLFALVYVLFVTADVPPMFSLYDVPYYFDGGGNGVVNLPTFVCVKGNNARSIQFQMKTTQQFSDDIDTFPPIIGKY